MLRISRHRRAQPVFLQATVSREPVSLRPQHYVIRPSHSVIVNH